MMCWNLLADDAETRVIVMYLEDIHDARRFMKIAKKTTKEYKKPIIVLNPEERLKAQKRQCHTQGL